MDCCHVEFLPVIILQLVTSHKRCPISFFNFYKITSWKTVCGYLFYFKSSVHLARVNIVIHDYEFRRDTGQFTSDSFQSCFRTGLLKQVTVTWICGMNSGYFFVLPSSKRQRVNFHWRLKWNWIVLFRLSVYYIRLKNQLIKLNK